MVPLDRLGIYHVFRVSALLALLTSIGPNSQSSSTTIRTSEYN